MKAYDIFDSRNDHLYVLRIKKTESGKVYSLFASHCNSWSPNIKGVLLFRMTNTGNGLLFHRPVENVDYPEAEYIRILLHADEVDSVNKKYKPRLRVVSEKDLIEL